jgi:hypothetical protein
MNGEARHKIQEDTLPSEIPEPKDSDQESRNLAVAEAKAFANRDLDADAQEREHKRKQELRNTFHRAGLYGIWLCFSLVIVALLCFVWNELAPASWQWMGATQVSTLRTFFFSSAVATVIGGYLGPRLK